MFRSFCAALLLTLCALATAQAPDMNPPAELKKLDWLIGEWSGTTKWVMQGMEGEGPMTMKNEWEGQFLKSATVTEADGVKMTELSLLGWNAKTKKFDSWTFTNFGATPRLEHGELEGDKLVMASEPWDVMGQKMEGRGTMTKKSATEILFILEFKMDGKWVKAAEGTYRKK